MALAGRRRQIGSGSAALDGAASWWRSGLRSFVIVGLSAVVPLVLLSLLFGYRASTQQRQAAEFQASMRIEGAAHRVDSILAAQSAAALGVAGFRSVGLGDYPHLYEHLQLMPGRHPEWSNIILAAETGERIMDLRSPFGRLLPPLDLSGLPPNSPTGTVVIGGIAPPGTFAKGRSIPLYATTLGKDGQRLVVVIALDPILFETVLEEAGLPADWRGAVLDSDGEVVARSDNSPLAVGERAKDSPRLQSEGKTFSLAAPISQAQWNMLCDIPTELLDREVNAAWWLMLVLGGGALGLAVVLASLVARDMAERRQMELQRADQRLQASEAWRLLALDAADIGTWHWDAVSGTLQGCERCRQIFDVTGPSLALRPLLGLFFPGEARAVIGAALASYRAGRAFEQEFRIRLSGGERWVQLYGRPLFDDRGRPIGTYGVLIDIDEQKRAEAEHRLLQGRLHSAQEEERLRISRELHDRVGQSVTGLSLAVKKLEATQGVKFDDIKAMILEISRDVHRAAVELRPTALDDFGLLGAIETYLREWQQRTGLTTETFVTGLAGLRLAALVETTAYRIIVELLTNIARHAEASTVSLTLTVRPDLLMLIVEDNGRGMRVPAPAGHLGLLGIRERLELIGGEMKIETAPGEGTAVFVRIPLPASQSRGEAA